MMHRLRRYDVLRCAQYDAARFTRNDAMFAPKHQAKPTTLASAASLVKRHHLPKANIIQKTHLCRQTKVRFLLNYNAVFDTGCTGCKVAFCATNRKLDSYKSFQN